MAGKSFIFSFDDVEVHEREFTLVKAGEVLPVEPKAFRVLLILLRNPGKLIGKEDLLNAVWGDAAVTDNSLARSIALLRRLLGDETRNPRYIETVATVGYRFICKVEVLEDASRELEGIAKPAIPVSGESAAMPASGEAADAATAPPQTNAGGDGKKPAGTRKRLPGWLIPGAVVFAAGVAAGIWYLHRLLPPPRITAYTQITHDGHLKYPGGTDGIRVYFAQESPFSILQVGITGGDIAKVSVGEEGDSGIFNVSPDGSSLLVGSNEVGNPDQALSNVRILGGSRRRLGHAISAAFSPDGNSVAYSPPEGEIWLVRIDGTGAHKLAAVGGKAYGLAWSPDGGTIRFNGSKDNSIWEISSSGSNLHQVLPGFHVSGWQCCGIWTSDGKFFLFLSNDPASDKGQIWALDERRGLLRRPPTEPIQLTTGPIVWGSPIPGKDGKKIFSAGFTLRGELTRYDPQTKNFQPFLGGISAEYVSFSRDGRYVAYVSFPEGILWRANADGSNPVQLTDPPIYALNPCWSPDGTQIAFADMSSGDHSISYIVSSQGGVPQRLMPGDDNDQADPNWSPDGRKIVFGWGKPADPKTAHLVFLDMVSHQLTTVPGSAGMGSPRWSPDGRYIAAIESRMLRIFDLKTQQWSPLLTKGHVGFPSFSRDSQFIYFLRLRPDLGVFRIRVTGGEEERVADLKDQHLTGYFAFSMSLDPTDAPLLLRDTGSDDIYALTLEEK